MKTKKTCQSCLIEFIPSSSKNQKYCSHICSSKGKTLKRILLICLTCKTNFTRLQRKNRVHKYCSFECQNKKIKPPLPERYENHVIKNGDSQCWSWKNFNNKNDYPALDGIKAHRISWEIYKGKIPKGMHILHLCDNRNCTNPNHLFLGTHRDNMRDMFAKNRRHKVNPAKGELHGNSKLTNEIVHEIKRLLESGVKGIRIAERFHVSPVIISSIKTGKTWAHLSKE